MEQELTPLEQELTPLELQRSAQIARHNPFDRIIICPICREYIEKFPVVQLKQCNHIVHTACFAGWVEMSELAIVYLRCPQCATTDITDVVYIADDNSQDITYTMEAYMIEYNRLINTPITEDKLERLMINSEITHYVINKNARIKEVIRTTVAAMAMEQIIENIMQEGLLLEADRALHGDEAAIAHEQERQQETLDLQQATAQAAHMAQTARRGANITRRVRAELQIRRENEARRRENEARRRENEVHRYRDLVIRRFIRDLIIIGITYAGTHMYQYYYTNPNGGKSRKAKKAKKTKKTRKRRKVRKH
jgi:hypothetical protein